MNPRNLAPWGMFVLGCVLYLAGGFALAYGLLGQGRSAQLLVVSGVILGAAGGRIAWRQFLIILQKHGGTHVPTWMGLLILGGILGLFLAYVLVNALEELR